MKANDVYYDERNDRYITLLSRNDAKVWSAQVEEMGESGAYDMVSIALFTEQELGHFERRY